MGTRNLTAVMVDGEYKLAQYGQWDGYPGGQGLTALDFCRKNLTTAKGRSRFKKQLERVRFVTEDELRKIWNDVLGGAKSAATLDGFVTVEESDRFNKAQPYFSRDHGAKILKLVSAAKGEVLTKNSIDFAGESLFCEWAYVIDLDKLSFEVFKGFNQNPAKVAERFKDAKRDPMPGSNGAKYLPVSLLLSFSLKKLPTNKKFLAMAKDADEDEEDVAQGAMCEENGR